MSGYQAEAQITSSSSVEGDDVFVDDQRGDGKKKKFKPFQKVRNFFRGGSSKKRKPDEGDGLGYSRSTGALHHKVTGADDDDDGGFRRKGLAGSRSISEDSVFQLEPKEPGIAGVLKGQTVSMEAINTGFQAELFSKLKARQSDSDLDEGLPYGPAPMISPTSHMFHSRARAQSEPGPEKPAQDSQLSLYSMDGSEEDLFSSNWKSGVASVKTRSSSGSELDREMDIADFEDVASRSTHLSNDAAKHRISVKPKSRRLSAKMSMKRKEKPTTPTLSGVQEEPSSPVKLPDSKLARPSSDEHPGVARPIPIAAPQKSVLSTTIAVGSPPHASSSVIPARSEPRDIPGAPRRHMDESELNKARSLSPISTSPVSKAALEDVKLRSRPLSGKFEGVELKREPLQSDNELSKAFNRAKRISRKYGDDGNIVDNNTGVVTKQVEVKKTVDTSVSKPVSAAKEDTKVTTSGKDSTALSQHPSSQMTQSMTQSMTSTKPQSSSTTTPTSTPISPGVTGVSFVLKKEPLRPGNKTPDKPASTAPESHPLASAEPLAKETKDIVAEPGKKEISGATSRVPTGASFGASTRAPIGASTGASVSPAGALVSEVNPDISSPAGKKGSEEKLSSPREDYRLKRQNRSKTLPVSKEMIDKAEDMDKPGSRTGSPPLKSMSRSEYDNVSSTPKPIQSKRSSWAPAGAAGSSSSATTTPSADPPWMVRAKLKNMEQENQNQNQNKEVKMDIKKDVKTELKSSAASSSEKLSDKPEKGSKVTEKPAVTSNIKSIIEKNSNSSPSMMSRSWAPTQSAAKSFDKPTVQASTKPVDRALSTDKPQQAKVTVASTTKPAVTSQSVSVKPSVTVSSKPAVTVSSAKPSVANTKTVSSVNTDTTKPSSQGIKPTVSSANKPVTDNKSLSQSVKSNTFDNKFSQFGGKASSQKPLGGTVQPLSQSVKVSTQSASRPTVGTSANIAKSSEPVKPSVSSADTKKNVGQENKKQETDTKRDTGSKTSTPKPGRSEGNMPPWKQALNQRKNNNPMTQQVKIEIIDKEPEKATEKKMEQKPSVEMRDKSKAAPTDKCSDANRSSKVLDMVRSFQNLQVT